MHLDVRPVWYQDSKVWAHKQARLDCTLDDFVPVQESRLRGTKVYIPHKTETFLHAYYGPGWRVPDPTYSNTNSYVDPIVKNNLSKVCMTMGDIRRMKEALLKEGLIYPNMGELIYKGAQELYPLEEYESKCGWY